MTCTVAGRWVEGVHGFGRSDGSARSGTVVGTAAADAGAAPAGHSHRFEPGITVRHGEVAALGVPTAVRGAAPGSGSDGDRHRAVVTLPAGARLCPGFVDHHLHLLAMAAARCSIDLSDAASLTEVFNRISAAAGDDPHRGALAAAGTAAAAGAVGTGAWLRGWGIDEADLAEGRLPTAAELDALGPHRPLVLHHRTGHSRILNRAARANGGHAPPLPEEQLVEALRQISDELCAAGVVAVTDATHTNDRAGIELLAGLLDRPGSYPG